MDTAGQPLHVLHVRRCAFTRLVSGHGPCMSTWASSCCSMGVAAPLVTDRAAIGLVWLSVGNESVLSCLLILS